MRRVALALALLAALPGAAAAQYFGQNKVQYSTFNFEIIKTEHFDVHYYAREREAALDAARMAERSYARLSRLMNHEFKARKPIILYASQSDFAQTNAVGVDFDPEVKGRVSIPKARRVSRISCAALRTRSTRPSGGSRSQMAQSGWISSSTLTDGAWNVITPRLAKNAMPAGSFTTG